jgi:hypothetical protein
LYTERNETGSHPVEHDDARKGSFFRCEFGSGGETIASERDRSDVMTNRIGIWASAGVIVAAGWALYAFVARPMTFADPVMILVQLTCPIAILRAYPLRLEWVLLANAATYALVGLLVETLRHQVHHAR